jgi:hypothetical protein
MVFDLAVNIHAFPKCAKCGNEMALVKVTEMETEALTEDHGSILGPGKSYEECLFRMEMQLWKYHSDARLGLSHFIFLLFVMRCFSNDRSSQMWYTFHFLRFAKSAI